MKKGILLLALMVYACTSSFEPATRAEGYVWRNYPDCKKIIMVSVDTITLGDNLEYRINQQKRHIEYAKSQVRLYEGLAREFKQTRALATIYNNELHTADSALNIERRMLAGLDSLKRVTSDIADTPAAYEVCVAYNSPGNLVWIQLNADGTLLKMSKTRTDMLLTPGADMPGYFDIYRRFYHRE